MDSDCVLSIRPQLPIIVSTISSLIAESKRAVEQAKLMLSAIDSSAIEKIRALQVVAMVLDKQTEVVKNMVSGGN